jgi:putative glutamine amidotransferase
MAVPWIGITTTRRPNPAGVPLISVPQAYVQAILQAGGCPVMIPLGQPEALLDAVLPGLDGILFTGGGDIEPGFYGAEAHPRVSEVDVDRDRVELHLFGRAVEAGLPFLGICRGLQLVNVGLGGTLYADIAEQRPGAEKHDFSPGWPRDFLAHPVQVKLESRLGRILAAPQVRVNSLHHQGVDRLAPSLVATACSPDGLVEAVELPGHPFGLAVQWHPECLTAYERMRALFRAFVGAAGEEKRET